MTVPANNLQAALDLHQAGRLQEAESAYNQIINSDPFHADALHLLGVLQIQKGNPNKAIEHIKCAIKLRPGFAPYHNNLGLAYKESNKYSNAKSNYEEAIRLDPKYAVAYLNLGHTLRELSLPDEAKSAYMEAVKNNPTLAEAYHGYGRLLQELGQIDNARVKHEKAISLAPKFAEAHFNHGETLEDLGRFEEAVKSYEKTLQIRPDHIEAYHAIGLLLEKLGKAEDACKWWKQSICPPHSDGQRLRSALSTPMIFMTAEDMRKQRSHLDEKITFLNNENLSIKDPLVEVNSTNFYAAYHGVNNRSIQSRIASLYIRACPSLNFISPGCLSRYYSPSGKKFKIGFVSRFFHMHTIGEVTVGLIQKLCRKSFEVILFYLPGPEDDLGRLIQKSADKVVMLPSDLESARNLIANEHLDLILYCDIGMDPFTYFLAFARLAPVQCVTWGHPDTTGIPTVDYFLSCDDQEPEDAQNHYTEKLVRLPGLPTYYIAPSVFPPQKTRAHFNLNEHTHYYFCSQAPFKVHPDFDQAIREILLADRKGKVLFARGHNSSLTHQLLRRFHRTMPDVVDRIQFLPHQTGQDYLHLLPLCDVILDTTCFSGGNTALKAFSVAAPIVTLPGSFARSRTTYACYKQMGILDCVAKDLADYIRIALRLANEPVWRSTICEQIKKNSHILFENIEVVRAMERFFIEAIERHQGTPKA